MAGTIGRAVGNLFMEGVARIPGIDLPREKEARKKKAMQKIMGESFSGLEQSISQGAEAGQAQIQALAKASAGLAAEGFTEEATAMRTKLVELVQSQEARTLELNKLRVDTKVSQANLDKLLEPEEEDESTDELIRMQERRELLRAHMQANPNSAAIAEQLDEVNARINNKLINVPLGRTDADERAINPTKAVMTELQKSFINTSERLDGMRQIGQSMNLDALTLGGKLKKLYFSSKEIVGLDLSPEEKAQLQSQAVFLQNTATELNDYIRSITGAAMTIQEVPRITKGMPNPDDSPSEFMSKYNNKLRQLQGIQNRAMEVLRTGDIALLAVPFEDFMPPLDLENFDPATATDADVDAAIKALTQ